ncbi:hypothetical protein [Pseudomonas sp. CGJS7]|uniref:hypothetical protein n=1 Tax=Pseudomonas sp. CGJS7 TaxID=3109348 RepID=UPI00300A4D5E
MNPYMDSGASDGMAWEEIGGVWIAPGDGPMSWTYRARAPSVAPGADGRPQFAMIGAGAVTVLALTAMWGVPAATLDALRAELAARAQVPPAQIQLSPAPVEVGEVRLMLGDGHGEYVQLAKAACSGVPPYHAAFNLMLDQTQAEKVRRALNGEHGWLELRYAATDAAAARSSRSVQDSESVEVKVSLGDAQGRVEASASAYSQVGVQDEAGYGAGRSRTYSADAADWGLPKP